MSSIHDVAKKAGVSTATVSRMFTAPELLNEQTHERVLEAARQLNYQPRRARTASGKGKDATAANQDSIGFQFFAAAPSDMLFSNSFYASILTGAESEAAQLGLHLLLHTTDRHSMAQEMPKMVRKQAVGGMLLVGTADPAILAAFAAHVPKIVLVDNRDETGLYESVVSDGFGGGHLATHFLLERGHRRIAFFLDEPEAPTFRDRLRGYYCAQIEGGILPEMRYVIRGHSKEESGVRLRALLTSPNPPTALLAANDENAFAVMRICREMGLQIPGNISLIGFDDIPFSTHTDPPLTTVRVDKETLGRLAVRRLYSRMHSEASETPVCHMVPVSLVERESCRAI